MIAPLRVAVLEAKVNNLEVLIVHQKKFDTWRDECSKLLRFAEAILENAEENGEDAPSTQNLRYICFILNIAQNPWFRAYNKNTYLIRATFSLPEEIHDDREFYLINFILNFDVDGSMMKQTNEEGMTAFHVAAGRGLTEALKFFLERGAESSINHANLEGMTPLHLAAKGGHSKALEFLLERGARSMINHVNVQGMTPLHLAAQASCTDAIKCLLEGGADPFLINRQSGKSFLHYFMAINSPFKHAFWWETFRQYDLKRIINIQDNNGDTAIGLCCWYNTDFIWLFRSNGADLNMANKEGHTPLHILMRGHPGYSGAFDSLLRKSSKRKQLINCADLRGYTSLHWAVAKGDSFLTELLVKNGADINVLDNFGRTPLHLAGLVYRHGVDCQTYFNVVEQFLSANRPARLCDSSGAAINDDFFPRPVRPLFDDDEDEDDELLRSLLMVGTYRPELNRKPRSPDSIPLTKFLLEDCQPRTNVLALDKEGNLPFFFAATINDPTLDHDDSQKIAHFEAPLTTIVYMMLHKVVQQHGTLDMSDLKVPSASTVSTATAATTSSK
jgi:ankyrin repeat protein